MCERAHIHARANATVVSGERTPSSVYKLVCQCWLQLFKWKASSRGSNYNHGRKKLKVLEQANNH